MKSQSTKLMSSYGIKVIYYTNCTMQTSHRCVTCANESVSLISIHTAAVIAANGIEAISILTAVTGPISLTLIDI